MTNPATEINANSVGHKVRLKDGTVTGTVLYFDPWTYLCTVSWESPYGGGQSTVHRMYLEPA